MTPASARKAPNVRQRQLGMALRRLREAAKLSADEVAQQMDCSQTKITKIEHALAGVSKSDLFFLLGLYGIADSKEQDSYWALALAGREKGWWEKYKDVIGGSLGEYISFEASADEIHTWSLGTIHGLLQTEAYARATFEGGPDLTPETIDRVVSARLERQKRLISGELRLWAILDETLLNRQLGGRQVSHDQLTHLLQLPKGVTLQVVPMGTTWHPGLSSAFTVMEFVDYPSVAFAEAPIAEHYVDAPEMVAEYSMTFDRLRAAGANPKESRAMIQAAVARLKN